MKFIQDNKIPLTVLFLALIAGATIITLQVMETNRLERVKQEYDVCVNTAYDGYKKDFEYNCMETQGIIDCPLDGDMAQQLESQYMIRKNTCIEEMKAKR
jgi:hypothetical protein